jgi:phosphoribosylformylglycinamidine synthase subunit PurL
MPCTMCPTAAWPWRWPKWRMAGGLGAEVENHPTTPRRWWFGEDQGRYIVTVPDVAAFQAQLAKGTRNEDTARVGVRRIGNSLWRGDSVLFGTPFLRSSGGPPAGQP